MSELKATPGPWFLFESTYPDNSWDGNYSIQISGGACLADIHRSVGNETDFNAHLIAAAPELYEALEKWIEMEDCEEVGRDWKVRYIAHLRECRALLAKARGESND